MLDNVLYLISLGIRPLDEFVNVLEKHEISILVDIRSEDSAQTESSSSQRYNQTQLRDILESMNIIYHLAGRQLGVIPRAGQASVHTQLPESLKGYAEYMQGPEFSRAASQLSNLAKKGVMAIMCAEEDLVLSPCGLIGDYLLLQGMNVNVIVSDGRVVEHRLSVNARRESAELIYDRHIN